MNKNNEILNFKKELESKVPNLINAMSELKADLGPILFEYFEKFGSKTDNFLNKLRNFRLKLVIDNNILFGEIYGLIKGNKKVESSFLYKIASHNKVQLFAPPFVMKEILEKLNAKIKPKDLNKAISFAKILLEKIDIKEAFWTDSWVRAKQKIGHKDMDDVNYFALCLDIENDGIISKDKIFSDYQNDVKTWKIEETDGMTTQYEDGLISFFILEQVPLMYDIISTCTKIFFLTIFELLSSILNLIGSILIGGIKTISKIPKELLMIGGISLFAMYLLSPEFRNNSSSAIVNAKQKISIWLEKLVEIIEYLVEMGIELFEVFKPFVKDALMSIGYLSSNLILSLDQIDNLKK